jgi:hypothetical protein
MKRLTWCLAAAALGSCGGGVSRTAVTNAASARLPSAPSAPYVMFISVASDDTFHHVALAGLASLTRMYVTPLTCERVYFSADRGLCLNAEAQGIRTVWFADVFDGAFQRLFHLPLNGTPSRVRLSPDGRRAAATMFESGHEYDEHGFATRTTLIDTISGTLKGDLEQFVTYRDGQRFSSKDFNFWGATFASDNDTFYATLQTGSVAYLVKGSVDKRAIEVLRPGVECPSLSPDNTRIAFKKRMGTQSRGWWQIAVLPVDTLQDRLVATETRSVDDQVEWLDADRVAYHLTGGSTAADLWAVRVDGSAPPELLRPASYSPAVIRQTIRSK